MDSQTRTTRGWEEIGLAANASADTPNCAAAMASRLEQSRSITPAREERRLEYAAAIDFGTSNCSLAFAIRGNQPENIDLGQNDGLRVPAALLIKVKEDGHSIDGYENNQGKYIYNIDTGVRAQDKNLRSHEYEKFRYFECFKMQLRNDTVE